MRIMFLNSYKEWGGGEKNTIKYGKGLMDRGHDVVISCPPKSQTRIRAKEAGLEVFPFSIGPDIAFWKIPPFLKYLKKNKIEVLFCVQNKDVKIGALAARMAGTPAIFAYSGLATMKRKLSHKIPFTKFIDGMITVTKSIKELYESYGWFSDNFFHVIYEGLELPEIIESINLHNEFDLSQNSKVIVGTGRLVKQKRFDLLIKVAQLAKNENLNWRFLVVGKGRLENGLKQMSKDFDVDDYIKFIGFRKNVFSILNAADLFVLSSDDEGMSNALKEAMAVGKACVSTDVFGVSELFQEGKSGIKVKKGDSLEIFNAIKKILTNSKLKHELEENASDLIRTSFTMEKMIKGVEKLFLEQIKKSKNA